MAYKVAVIKCATYEEEKVYLAVKESVALLGGFGMFVKPGMKVLIKPNLLAAMAPEKAVTTHPAVVKAVIRLVKEEKGLPFLGDCHGGVLTGTEILLAETKMTEAAAEAGAEIVNLSKFGSDLYEGLAVSKSIKEFALIINLCKFKTHGLAVLSGAVKNCFGLVPGLHKAAMHRLYPKAGDFCDMLLKVSDIVNPGLSIMDGVVGMEGDGPMSGSPRNLGVILAAKVPIALDLVMAKIAGLDPEALPVLSGAFKKGFRADEVTIIGEKLSNVVLKDFKFPSTFAVAGKKRQGFMGGFRAFLQPYLWKLATVKPFIDNSICQKCNECVKACPVKAIDYRKGFPAVSKIICIECYCCHELCRYKAVSLDKNLLVKIWKKRQSPKR